MKVNWIFPSCVLTCSHPNVTVMTYNGNLNFPLYTLVNFFPDNSVIVMCILKQYSFLILYQDNTLTSHFYFLAIYSGKYLCPWEYVIFFWVLARVMTCSSNTTINHAYISNVISKCSLEWYYDWHSCFILCLHASNLDSQANISLSIYLYDINSLQCHMHIKSFNIMHSYHKCSSGGGIASGICTHMRALLPSFFPQYINWIYGFCHFVNKYVAWTKACTLMYIFSTLY